VTPGVCREVTTTKGLLFGDMIACQKRMFIKE